MVQLHTETLGNNKLDTDLCPIQRRLFQAWDSRKGPSEIMKHLASRIVILDMPRDDPVPSIIHVGKNSLAGLALGCGWRQETGSISHHDGHYADGILRAACGEPTLVHVMVRVMRGGRLVNAEYSRLILRCHNRRGRPFLIMCSTPRDLWVAPTPTIITERVRVTARQLGVVLGAEDRPLAEYFE